MLIATLPSLSSLPSGNKSAGALQSGDLVFVLRVADEVQLIKRRTRRSMRTNISTVIQQLDITSIPFPLSKPSFILHDLGSKLTFITPQNPPHPLHPICQLSLDSISYLSHILQHLHLLFQFSAHITRLLP